METVIALVCWLVAVALAARFGGEYLALIGGILPRVRDLIFAPFAGPLRNLRNLADRVWSALRHAVEFFLDLLRGIARAWVTLFQQATYLFDSLVELGQAGFVVLRWLYRTVIPAAVRRAVRQSLRAARQLVEHAVHALRVTVRTVTRALRVGLRLAARNLAAVRRFLLSRVNRALDWITRVGRPIARLLAHPTRLVTWFLPHLVIPLVRWLAGHMEPLIRWAWPRVARLALDSVLGIERGLARIL